MIIGKEFKVEKSASKDETRFALTNLYLDTEGRQLWASDGRRLVAVEVEIDEADVSGPIPVEALKMARVGLGKRSTAWLECGADEVKILLGKKYKGVRLPRPELSTENKFPLDGCKEIMYKVPGRTFSVGLNAELLKGLADAVGADGGVKLTFTLPEGDDWVTSEIRVVSAMSSKARAMLMPLRLS